MPVDTLEWTASRRTHGNQCIDCGRLFGHAKILGRSLRQARTSGIDSVLEANDGAEALEKLNGDSIHLIFSDINMPNVNGLDFLRRLKETPHKDLPVIMVTTEGGEKTVMEAISLGAKGFIRKPFTTAQMEGAISKVMPD